MDSVLSADAEAPRRARRAIVPARQRRSETHGALEALSRGRLRSRGDSPVTVAWESARRLHALSPPRSFTRCTMVSSSQQGRWSLFVSLALGIAALGVVSTLAVQWIPSSRVPRFAGVPIRIDGRVARFGGEASRTLTVGDRTAVYDTGRLVGFVVVESVGDSTAVGRVLVLKFRPSPTRPTRRWWTGTSTPESS